jgi:hypothetical protein
MTVTESTAEQLAYIAGRRDRLTGKGKAEAMALVFRTESEREAFIAGWWSL